MKKNEVRPVSIASVLFLLMSAGTLVVYGRAIIGDGLTDSPEAVIESKEVFSGFDLRTVGPFEYRPTPATDSRSLVLASPALNRFPMVNIGASPLPLVSGDIYIDATGNLVEVETDSSLVRMRPVSGTTICILDPTLRGRDLSETKSLLLPVRDVLRFTGADWISVLNQHSVATLCDPTHVSGRIRFGGSRPD